jgi:hypothetical protein
MNVSILLQFSISKKWFETLPKGTSFDSIQVLVSLEEESVTHHLDKISAGSKPQGSD